MKIVFTPKLLLECMQANPTAAEFCELVRSKTNSDVTDGIILSKVKANIVRLAEMGFPTKEGRKPGAILPKFRIERESNISFDWNETETIN